MCYAALARRSRTHVFGRRRFITTSRSPVPKANFTPCTNQCCGRGSTFSARRTLGALLISAADYVQASRWRRVLIAEVAPLYANYDVLVTAGPGPAPRLESWRTINFWQRPSLTTPFHVLGPTLAQCIGFTEDGLPLSMQIVGRPFDKATVLRVAHAYEGATPWRTRRPRLAPDAAVSNTLPPIPEPAPSEINAVRCGEIAATCRRAGLTLNERQFQQLCRPLVVAGSAVPSRSRALASVRPVRPTGHESCSARMRSLDLDEWSGASRYGDSHRPHRLASPARIRRPSAVSVAGRHVESRAPSRLGTQCRRRAGEVDPSSCHPSGYIDAHAWASSTYESLEFPV
jgi:Amidase